MKNSTNRFIGIKRIILASASPRRKELLKQIGWEFEVMASEADETVEDSAPQDMVEELSRRKAEAVLRRIPAGNGDVLVIGADTVVACEGRILGKPKGEEDAKRMLRLLQGKSHYVYTGVTLCRHGALMEEKQPCFHEGTAPDGKTEPMRQITFHEVTRVDFFPMTEQEIQEYIDTGDVSDKAGAYGIQGFCARYIKGVEGDYNNVVGLPIGRLYQRMKELCGFFY